MFEVNGKLYELKYNMKTIEQIESTTGKSLVATLNSTQGLLSLTDLKVFFGFALFNDVGKRVSPKQGMEIAEILIENDGYMTLNEAVVSTISEDCPFLFQVN